MPFYSCPHGHLQNAKNIFSHTAHSATKSNRKNISDRHFFVEICIVGMLLCRKGTPPCGTVPPPL